MNQLGELILKKLIIPAGFILVGTIAFIFLWIFTFSEIYDEYRFRNDQAVYRAEQHEKLKNVSWFANLKRIGWVALPIAGVGLAFLYVAAVAKRKSVHRCRIGQHSDIPVEQKDLQKFYPIAVNLSLAEIEASASTAHEKAYNISRKITEDTIAYTRAIAGGKSLIHAGSGTGMGGDQETSRMLPVGATPTFGDLLRTGQIAPGSPLIMGYNQEEKHFGQPEYRDLAGLKSLAIAGWQGSGKTLSTAYIIGSAVFAYGVEAYVVDPHRGHDKGLYYVIQPLETARLITVINPFDTPKLIEALNARLDRRLSGDESSEKGILLVIDELARLAKMECFDVLVAFLERCTEETRKANITFIGGSHKWTARHFKGRADIRGCMNSMLIHKTKPSQADLLLEDSREKKLVKQLNRPGQAILVTDFADTHLVQMPFCIRKDMETVAEMIDRKQQPIQIQENSSQRVAEEVRRTQEINGIGAEAQKELALQAEESTEESTESDHPLTPKFLNEQLTPIGRWGQRELERQTGVNQSRISKFRNRITNKDGSEALNQAEKDRLYEFLTSAETTSADADLVEAASIDGIEEKPVAGVACMG